MPLPHQPPPFTWSTEFPRDHTNVTMPTTASQLKDITVNVTLTGIQSNDQSATATETATPSDTTDTPATRSTAMDVRRR